MRATFSVASCSGFGQLAVAIALSAVTANAAQRPAPPQAALRIVVIAGEDAVNIIQQKTAVAPIVEVRDRNDQPVSGAVVNFAIRNGRATFGGARTLSVTTDVVGRAVASGLTPTGSGALQISASAAFQGQTAAVTIAQTNVLTAAQAAAIGSTGGAGGSAGGAAGGAAGGGGGMSGTTIGLIAGGVGAGVIGATQLGGDGNESPSGPLSNPISPPTSPTIYNITFTPSLAVIADCPQYTGPTGPGVGPFGMTITLNSDGTFSDLVSIQNPVARLTGVATATSVTGTFACTGGGGPTGGVDASGTAPNFQGTWNWGGQSGTVGIQLRQ